MENINYKDANIIIIDDDVQVLESVKDALEVRDMQIRTFSNPIEGLEYIKNNNVDVLILDYYMPEMNGSEVVEKLREYNNNTIVILQTGFADQIPPLEMIDKINIQGYVDKEEGIEKLILTIKSAIKTSELLKEIKEKENKIETLTYKKALIGNLISNLVNESMDQLFKITLANGIIKKDTEKYIEQNKSIEEGLERIKDLYEALNFEYKKEMNIVQLKKTIEELLKAQLLVKLVELTFEIDNNDIVINNPKEIIYIVIKIVYLLMEENAKNINIRAKKEDETYIEISADIDVNNVNIEEVEMLQESENRVIIVDNNSINIKLS